MLEVLASPPAGPFPMLMWMGVSRIYGRPVYNIPFEILQQDTVFSSWAVSHNASCAYERGEKMS